MGFKTFLIFAAVSFLNACPSHAQDPRPGYTVSVRLADEQKRDIRPAGEGFRFLVIPNDNGERKEFFTNEKGSFVIPPTLMENGSRFTLVFAPTTAPGKAERSYPDIEFRRGAGFNLLFVLSVSISIQFKTDQFEISHDVKKNVEEVEYLRDFIATFPGRNILIIGHTDDQGTDDSNLLLSKRRAISLKKILMQLGFDGRTIATDGKGSSEPKADNTTEEGRAANRRIEVRIL